MTTVTLEAVREKQAELEQMIAALASSTAPPVPYCVPRSAEPHETDGSVAWNQDFASGFQLDSHKSYKGRARAVRTVPIGAKA